MRYNLRQSASSTVRFEALHESHIYIYIYILYKNPPGRAHCSTHFKSCSHLELPLAAACQQASGKEAGGEVRGRRETCREAGRRSECVWCRWLVKRVIVCARPTGNCTFHIWLIFHPCFRLSLFIPLKTNEELRRHMFIRRVHVFRFDYTRLVEPLNLLTQTQGNKKHYSSVKCFFVPIIEIPALWDASCRSTLAGMILHFLLIFVGIWPFFRNMAIQYHVITAKYKHYNNPARYGALRCWKCVITLQLIADIEDDRRHHYGSWHNCGLRTRR